MRFVLIERYKNCSVKTAKAAIYNFVLIFRHPEGFVGLISLSISVMHDIGISGLYLKVLIWGLRVWGSDEIGTCSARVGPIVVKNSLMIDGASEGEHSPSVPSFYTTVILEPVLFPGRMSWTCFQNFTGFVLLDSN